MNRVVALLLLFSTLGLAYVILFGSEASPFLQGIFIGLTVMGLLDLLQAITNLDEEPLQISVALEPVLAPNNLTHIETEIFGRSNADVGHSFSSTLRLSPNPSFALVEMRIQIERSLRSLAERSDVVLAVSQLLSTRQLIDRMIRENILPWPLVRPLRQIIEVTDKAFQGQRVEWVDAEAIVSSGARIIHMIESLPKGVVVDSG